MFNRDCIIGRVLDLYIHYLLMKILNVSYQDYANFAYNNATALVAAGVDAKSICRKPHQFSYEKQSESVTETTMEWEIKNADVIQIFHSFEGALDICKKHEKKNVIVYHTGTKYRLNPAYYNDKFNPHVVAAFTDQCEFIGTGMKNEEYIATAVDDELFKMRPGIRDQSKLIIAHYPSNPGVKGTDKIREMLKPFADEFTIIIDEKVLPHEQNLKRIADCDVYIELFATEQHGKPYGCFGVTAFEAAALGKMVVTQNICPDVYDKNYGARPFVYANTEADFHYTFDQLIRNPGSATSSGHYARILTQQRHSYESAGKRINNLILKYVEI